MENGVKDEVQVIGKDCAEKMITIKPDNLTTADAVFLAFVNRKIVVSLDVDAFVIKAKYGPSDEFKVVVHSPKSLGFGKDCTLGEVFEYAKTKHNLQFLSDQQVFRLRYAVKEQIGQTFYAATKLVLHNGKSHLYLFDRFVLGGYSSLQDIEGDIYRKLFSTSKILFRVPE